MVDALKIVGYTEGGEPVKLADLEFARGFLNKAGMVSGPEEKIIANVVSLGINPQELLKNNQ